jgi:hypothetical protein
LVTLDAGYCSLAYASLIDEAGYDYVLGLKENQPELWSQAQPLLPLVASQHPEVKVVERDHKRWVRRRVWRTESVPAGWSGVTYGRCGSGERRNLSGGPPRGLTTSRLR